MEAAPAATSVETREPSSSSPSPQPQQPAEASSSSTVVAAEAVADEPATPTPEASPLANTIGTHHKQRNDDDATTATTDTAPENPTTTTTTTTISSPQSPTPADDNDITDDSATSVVDTAANNASASVYREPPGLYDLEHTEWESTITVMSTADTYDRIAKDPDTKNDMVILWVDGTRLASRRLERKVIQSSKNLLIFYNDRWVPLVRTTAQETLVSIYPPDKYQQTTYRSVVYLDDGIRVTHNKTATANGLRYTIEYEIEYEPGTRYTDIVEHEQRLLECFVKRAKTDGHDADPVRTLPAMEMAHMFECVMSRLQLWNCFDDRLPYAWAYKWNGVKAKILLAKPYSPSKETPGQTEVAIPISYWTDDCIIGKRTLRVPIHSATAILGLLTNVCCAIEVLEDRIVLLEAIGTQVAGQMHTAEPQTNRAFLDAMGNLVKEAVRQSGGRPDCITLGNLRLQIQRYYDAPRPSNYDPIHHDGFVLMQNRDTEGLIIRWKFPTTDVKCIAEPGVRAVRRSANGGNQPVLSRYYCTGDGTIRQLATEGEPGGIYEIDPNFIILRKRTDRLAASSASEYNTFLASCQMIPASSS